MKPSIKIILIIILLAVAQISCRTISPNEAANGKAKCGKRLG